MPNVYATPGEIKASVPDGIRTGTVKYDPILYRLAGAASRAIDGHCKRRFYPIYAALLFDAGRYQPDVLWVDDLVEITSVEISDDDGLTYSTLASTDYICRSGENRNARGSWDNLKLDPNGDYASWSSLARVTGWWAYHTEREAGWEDSGIDLNAAYTAGGVSLSVADAGAWDAWQIGQALEPGRLLRIDSEMLEVSAVSSIGAGNTATVLGARNGTAAAAHADKSSIKIWRPVEDVQRAAVIMAVRQIERGYQGFGDTRTGDGTIMQLKGIDPDVQELLSIYRKTAVG